MEELRVFNSFEGFKNWDKFEIFERFEEEELKQELGILETFEIFEISDRGVASEYRWFWKVEMEESERFDIGEKVDEGWLDNVP